MKTQDRTKTGKVTTYWDSLVSTVSKRDRGVIKPVIRKKVR